MAKEERNNRLLSYIAETEKAIKEAETEISKAEEAGIDVTAEREELERKKDELERIKAVYGV